ncbi:uncharacterized protein LOC143462505 [Clavelina lepadiformis]|uniref:uncharacterized protein LOC143462505 n=1 Tax=Clavelina lepadiformis TaxID=159417 RepID=UPI0040422F99
MENKDHDIEDRKPLDHIPFDIIGNNGAILVLIFLLMVLMCILLFFWCVTKLFILCKQDEISRKNYLAYKKACGDNSNLKGMIIGPAIAYVSPRDLQISASRGVNPPSYSSDDRKKVPGEKFEPGEYQGC